MTWIVGIDEAGYGPNLGPLVMTAVACRVPDASADADLWQVLQEVVRKNRRADDARLHVADSKEVYSSGRGLHDLERGVLAALSSQGMDEKTSLRDCLHRLCSPSSLADLDGEPWYAGTTDLPLEADLADCRAAAEQLDRVCESRQVRLGLMRGVAVCPVRFNQILDRWDSKGAVLGHALTELLSSCLAETDGATEAVHFFIDKHGGRNTYSALLQNALTQGVVTAQEEGRIRSVYHVLGLEREVRMTFQPRADAEHFCVALASMVAKYLREVLMREFNAFWETHVPGLKPTAGYPADAGRFLGAIRPAAQRLGIAESALWRRK